MIDQRRVMSYRHWEAYSEAIGAGFSQTEAYEYAGFVQSQGLWIPSFESQKDAIDYVDEIADDPCTDNFRFAFDDDLKGIAVYEDQKASGCCGFLDLNVVVEGRSATVGCNYGH